MMKQVLCTVFVSSVIFSQASPILAISIEQVPNPRRTNATWVSDTANILSSDTEIRLNRMISELEAKNGSEIAVVTVPETSPSASPKEFATKLFNHWGIGKRGKNNGVLFLISKGDRRVEIETGTGLVTVLPNSKVSSIIQEQVTLQFKQGKFDEGVFNGTQALVVTLGNSTSIPLTTLTSSNSTSQSSTSEVSSSTDSFFAFFLYSLVVIGLWSYFVWVTTRKKSKNNYSSSNNNNSYRSSNNSTRYRSSNHSSFLSSDDNNSSSCSSNDNNSSSWSSNDNSSSSWNSSDNSSSSSCSDFGGGSSGGDGGGESW